MGQADPALAMHEVADAILRRWAAQRTSPFADLVWDSAGHRLVVHRVPGNPDFDRDVLARGTALVGVALADAPRSQYQLRVIVNAILKADDLPLRVYGVGPHLDGTVEVHGQGDLAAARELFDSRFGPGVVVVSEGRPAMPL